MERKSLELGRQVTVDFQADADFNQRRSRPRHDISSCSCRHVNYSSAPIAAQRFTPIYGGKGAQARRHPEAGLPHSAAPPNAGSDL